MRRKRARLYLWAHLILQYGYQIVGGAADGQCEILVTLRPPVLLMMMTLTVEA